MSATAGCVIGLDVGGTRIKAGIVGTEHRILLDRTRGTGAADGCDAVAARILDLVTDLTEEACAAGLAESVLGAGRHQRDLLFLAIGTGIAGAMILIRRPYAGGGYAGEIGHLRIHPEGPPCPRGGRGCYVTVCAPELIVIGGGLAESGELLVEPWRASLAARLSFQREPRIVRAKPGDRAGLLGAALPVRRRAERLGRRLNPAPKTHSRGCFPGNGD